MNHQAAGFLLAASLLGPLVPPLAFAGPNLPARPNVILILTADLPAAAAKTLS